MTGMRLAATALVALALGAPAAPAAGAPKDPRLARVHSFAFAIGSGALAKPLGAYDLVVVDGQEASARRVAQLRSKGVIVLGYLSVGTVEKGRPWSKAARPYRLDLLAEWGEWYADVNAPGYRRLIANKVAPRMLRRKRFDGLFLDNTDMIETHPRRKPGMRKLAARLGKLVHSQRRLLFAQNVRPGWVPARTSESGLSVETLPIARGSPRPERSGQGSPR
jgi:hypothetical protein